MNVAGVDVVASHPNADVGYIFVTGYVVIKTVFQYFKLYKK